MLWKADKKFCLLSLTPCPEILKCLCVCVELGLWLLTFCVNLQQTHLFSKLPREMAPARQRAMLGGMQSTDPAWIWAGNPSGLTKLLRPSQSGSLSNLLE